MTYLLRYLQFSTTFSVGATITHGHLRRESRMPTTIATELVCVPRDAMIGAFIGPVLPFFAVYTLFSRKQPMRCILPTTK